MILTLILAVAGCAEAGTPAERATSVSAAPIRTDREPIVKRFPALGDFTEVHWLAATPGGDSRVPGPTDTTIQAVMVLQPQTAEAAAGGYEWEPAEEGWDAALDAGLREYLPDGASWQTSEQWAEEVRTPQYHGLVHLDPASGTVVLSVTDS